MANASSQASVSMRRSMRREATVEEALAHAVAIVSAEGAGSVTMSEIARRMGMRAPSLYKYFRSLNDIFDALFSRGGAALNAHVDEAVRQIDPGLQRLTASSREVLGWIGQHPGLAQLMFWRPVSGFVPSAAAFEPSQALWRRFRADLTAAVDGRELDVAADSDDALRLLTIVIGGISSQQMANEPGAPFGDGAFTSLTETALDMFVQHFPPPEPSRRRRRP